MFWCNIIKNSSIRNKESDDENFYLKLRKSQYSHTFKKEKKNSYIWLVLSCCVWYYYITLLTQAQTYYRWIQLLVFPIACLFFTHSHIKECITYLANVWTLKCVNTNSMIWLLSNYFWGLVYGRPMIILFPFRYAREF